MNCFICNREVTPGKLWRCDEHARCDDCGAREGLIYGIKRVECRACEQERIAREIEAFDGETDLTDDVTCPHCGHRHSDSWEMTDGTHGCDNCERQFELICNHEITYSTTKL